MALFLDIHTPKYKDKREVIWDMAEAMNKELLALRAAGCRCIQIEEPTFHFMANTFGKDHDEVKFMIDAFNREVRGAGRRRALDPHLLGQSEHAARHGGHQLRQLDRDLPGALPRRRLDARNEGPQPARTWSCSSRSSTI